MGRLFYPKFLRIIICTFAYLHSCTFIFAQNKDTSEYFSERTLRYEDRVYVKNVKTIQLSTDPAIMAPAIIKLNSEEKLFANFDDLDGDYKVYNYTIIHCSAKWEPSNILVSEYLDGFAENSIPDYRFSRTTIQKYTHYAFSFPNDGLKLTKSGNYLLEVYTDNNAEKVVFTKRFMGKSVV